MKENDTIYDVVVVGGGMIGLAAALGCVQLGLKGILLDSSVACTATELNLDRVSAISLSSMALLDELKASVVLDRSHVAPYAEMLVWDGLGQGRIHFDAASIGHESLGHIIPNDVLRLALTQVLNMHNTWQIRDQQKVEVLQTNKAFTEITTQAGDTFKAKLVIAADGAQSSIREMLSIEVDTQDYGHQAIVASVQTAKEHGGIARQVYYHGSPLAFLPLVDSNVCSIVWSLPPEQARHWMTANEASFCQALNHRMEGQLGDIKLAGKRYVFPLTRRHAKRYIGQRVVLVGDAKHSIHPMAGLGANLGFEDVTELMSQLRGAQVKQRDIGAEQTLRRYERARRLATTKVLLMMDLLKLVFNSEQSAVVVGRNLGLNLLDQGAYLKRLLIQQASGL